MKYFIQRATIGLLTYLSIIFQPQFVVISADVFYIWQILLEYYTSIFHVKKNTNQMFAYI